MNLMIKKMYTNVYRLDIPTFYINNVMYTFLNDRK